MRQHISAQALAAYEQKYADRPVRQSKSETRDQRYSHKSECREWIDQRAKKLSSHATRPIRQPSDGTSAPWASARLSAESASEVSPQAIGARAKRRVEGKCRRTRSRSCSTATTVRPSLCQRCNKCSRSSVVLSSRKAKGSSSKM